ncbi:MAG TPA: SRPBCC domain-containing protein [Bacteroidia bacterium]|nr:SRPBCC domain-containing protein [Bacteroidia bacterium]
MKNKNFTISFEVEQTPSTVFEAIKNVRGWWSGLYDETFEGHSEKIGDAFSFRAGNGAHYSKQELVELIPDKKIVWLVTDSDLRFLEKTDEWTGTKLCFDISKEKGKTRLTFTHSGLTPEIECYNSCAPVWTQYLEEKLLSLINKSSA